MLLIQDRAFLDVDVEACRAILGKFDIVAHLAFEADVRNEPVIGLGVKPRHVTCVGIPVRVPIGDVE
jgi:hypothetical protein